MNYLIGELFVLLGLTLLGGIIIGGVVAMAWRRRRGAGDRTTTTSDGGEQRIKELETSLGDSEDAVATLRKRLAKRESELTDSRRVIADLKSRFVEVAGLESEIVGDGEAARVSALQAEVARRQRLVRSGPSEPELDLAGGRSEPKLRAVGPTPERSQPGSEGPPPTRPPWAEAVITARQTEQSGDDLTAIAGVDRDAAAVLHSRGIHSFEQLANLSPTELAELDASLGRYAGRASADRWVAKAADLVADQRTPRSS